MADVSRVASARASGPPDARSRGQLLLVTALSLAILFVTLALILNTAIYTENLATRSGDIGGGTDAVRYQDAARDSVGGLIDYVNANNNSSHSTLNSNVEEGVDAFRNQSARQFAAGNRAVETTLDGTVIGTRIAQTNQNRNFTNASGTQANWTVVTDVSNARTVQINVTAAPTESPGSDRAFSLTLQGDGGATWRLNVTDDGGTTVGVKDGNDNHFTCSGSDDTPVINLTAGTVDGDSCEGLSFAEGIDTPYDLSIDGGDDIEGTYSMVVDNETLADTVEGSYPHLEDDGSGQPFATHAIYSANVTVVYETPRLYYNTTIRVAPGEPDG